MKFTIDTENKTIQIEEPVVISEFVKRIGMLLPEGANLEEWSIIPSIINLGLPANPWECPPMPWGLPVVTYATDETK